MAGHRFAANGNHEFDPQLFDWLLAISRLPIRRKYNCGTMAKLGQLYRQRSTDVGQSARLGKWYCFASRQQDIHEYALRR